MCRLLGGSWTGGGCGCRFETWTENRCGCCRRCVCTGPLEPSVRRARPSEFVRDSKRPVVLGFDVAVSVADEGRGIPSDRLPHLFRKFSRFEAEGEGGDTGLGLVICKGIVETHGGRICAESDGLGMGERFTFTIPEVEAAGSGPRSFSNRSSRRGAGERVRVLAVDDDPQALRYIRDALSRAGYAPVVTGDPEEAEKPGLVILDLMLPGPTVSS